MQYVLEEEENIATQALNWCISVDIMSALT